MASKQLQSWSDTAVTKSIIHFVEKVTDPGSPSYVEPRDRIAVFDNDGTLWCEKPFVQGGFITQRMAEMARKDPSLQQTQPWKAMFEGDDSWIEEAVVKHYGGDDSMVGVLAPALLRAFGDMDVEDFAAAAAHYMSTAEHPVHKRSYTELGYVPMIELLHHLEAHEFTCHIVSGGGRDFMRPVTESMYGIPADRVVGSSSGLTFVADASGARIVRTAALGILDDGGMKPIQIWERIGRRPILAAGNANGDVAMLQYTKDQPGETLALLVHHDDGAREFAYEAGAEHAFEQAPDAGWVTISMANDWKKVFAHQE